jgi:ElaB/YqjD/DUF883 family membrane-anchored ribosome-binding protein
LYLARPTRTYAALFSEQPMDNSERNPGLEEAQVPDTRIRRLVEAVPWVGIGIAAVVVLSFVLIGMIFGSNGFRF